MKKFILLLLILLIQSPLLAQSNLKNVGIAKYAVLEVLADNTPLRQKDCENSNRLTHFYKNTILFADKQTPNYYRVVLDNDYYGFINKKAVEVQAVIPEKRFDSIEKVTKIETKKDYKIFIETPFLGATQIKEDSKTLNFTLFDNHFDPNKVKIEKDTKFQYSKKIDTKFSLKYSDKLPLFGYGIEKYNKGYILSIKKSPKINKKKPLKNIVVIIDPGHGGSERGACAFGLEEKTINLEISKKLKKELRKRGAKVYLTRKKDKKVTLNKRIEFAKEKNADIYLSIHQNSLPNRKDIDKKHGVGTYYYQNQSKPLAQTIQKNLIVATKFRDDKVNHASFAVIRPTEFLSVLIECGYIIRKEEANQLVDSKFQKKISKAITKALEDYLKESY